MERLTERLGDYNNPKEICAVWVKNLTMSVLHTVLLITRISLIQLADLTAYVSWPRPTRADG
nr:MAG TPA: hypothetical protein [Caudoviricetes sp.]